MSFSAEDLFGNIDDLDGFSDDDNLAGTTSKRKQNFQSYNHDDVGGFYSNKKIRRGICHNLMIIV